LTNILRIFEKLKKEKVKNIYSPFRRTSKFYQLFFVFSYDLKDKNLNYEVEFILSLPYDVI